MNFTHSCFVYLKKKVKTNVTLVDEETNSMHCNVWMRPTGQSCGAKSDLELFGKDSICKNLSLLTDSDICMW